MPIQFPCPGCGLLLAVDERFAGGSVQCSRCQRVIAVPQPSAPPSGLGYPYPYPYPMAPGVAPGGPPPYAPLASVRPGAGLRIAGGVVAIFGAFCFMMSGVGAIATFEPELGSGGAGGLAVVVVAVMIWGIVAGGLACTTRRWAVLTSAYTQIAGIAVCAPSFVLCVSGARGAVELQDMFLVMFPVTLVVSGVSAGLGLAGARALR
jgi:hypothetical protein